MKELKKYSRRSGTPVAAVQLNLVTEGLVYHQWGSAQLAKSGDWLVDNGSQVYSVDHDSFVKSYKRLDMGKYEKVSPVWAGVASEDGVIETKEGTTSYEKGDFLVFNDERGTDGYAMNADQFNHLYSLDTDA